MGRVTASTAGRETRARAFIRESLARGRLRTLGRLAGIERERRRQRRDQFRHEDSLLLRDFRLHGTVGRDRRRGSAGRAVRGKGGAVLTPEQLRLVTEATTPRGRTLEEQLRVLAWEYPGSPPEHAVPDWLGTVRGLLCRMRHPGLIRRVEPGGRSLSRMHVNPGLRFAGNRVPAGAAPSGLLASGCAPRSLAAVATPLARTRR